MAATSVATGTDVDFSKYDQEQVKFMEETCILLDENDKAIGQASKKACMYNIHAHLYISWIFLHFCGWLKMPVSSKL